MPYVTIGHSTRTLPDFIGLLGGSGVGMVVDVRKIPGSARCPQFDQDTLSTALGAAGIGYVHAKGLGGRRPVSLDVPYETNGWWQNRSFHNYADYALTADFAHAFGELRDLGRTSPAALMCAESVWWRCHRRIIADHLLAHGEDVRHILGHDHVEMAQMSSGAVVGPGGWVNYPAAITGPRS